MTEEKLKPIRKVILVGLPIDRAFSLFTDDIDQWWPLRTHSLEGEQAAGCVFEGREGGTLYETGKSTPAAVWAHVVTWAPPDLVELAWSPGDLDKTSTHVRIAFQALGKSRSRIELIHTGWPPDMLDRYVDYQIGWTDVLVKGYQAHAMLLSEEGQVGSVN